MPPTFLRGPRTTAALYSRMTAFAAGTGGICTVHEDSGLTSTRGQPLKYLRIRSSGSGTRQKVLLIGGMHAREWAPPDALLQFAEYLVGAYRAGSALDLPAIRGSRYTTDGVGGAPGPDAILDLPAHRISSNEVQRVVDKLEIYIAPVVNPDGRDYTMVPPAVPLGPGDLPPTLWRKNDPPPDGTSPNPPPGRGANINGNFPVPRGAGAPAPATMQESIERYYGPDAGLATGDVNWSNDPTDWNVYGGPTEASEPETQFVQWLVTTKGIRFYMDVHSAAHILSYPWAMEKNGTDTTQKFSETAWDSTSGPHTGPAGHPGGRDGTHGTVYNEFFPADLLHQYDTVARSMRTAILNAAGADAAAIRRSSYNDMRRFGAPDFGHTGPGPFLGSIAELLYAAPASGMDWVVSRQFTDPTLAPVYGFAFECGDKEEGDFWPLYGDPSVPSDPTVPATDPAAGHQFPKIEREVVIGVMELLKFAAAWRPPTASRCYVATAAYGTSLHPAVQFVVQLRERELRKTRGGRRFLAAVEWIYDPIGPRVARLLAPRPRLRGIVRRAVVEPVIATIRRCDRATHRIRPRERRVAALVAMLTSIVVLWAAGAVALVVLAIWWMAHG